MVIKGEDFPNVFAKQRRKIRRLTDKTLKDLSLVFSIDSKQTITSVGAVRTGAMRDAVTVERESWKEYEVFSDVPYAIYVHEGSVNNAPPRPFFKMTFEREKEFYAKMWGEMLEELAETT